MKQIKGMIGLEIHVYLITKEKLFCRCRAVREKGATPNSFICPICTAQPGSKPMPPNKTAVEKAVQVGLMLNCKINNFLEWKRKHYDWPDLPKGFQNTLSGARAFPVGESGNFYGIKIRSIHLEEDPASWEPETGRVDYNRSGLPLIEIVTEPDFSTSEEVCDWLKKLLHNLMYLKAVHKDAGLKADINVNIPGKSERVEIKNINSIENIRKAIDYELERQRIDGGEMETRRFDEGRGITFRMRGKEEEQDYRFITEPDLQPLLLNGNFIQEQKNKIPEPPEKKIEKLVGKYKIGKKEADVLAKNLEVAEFFEKVAERVEPKFALHWINVELLGMLNYNKKTMDEIDIKAEHFAELLDSVKNRRITETQGKKILQQFYPQSFSIKEKGVEARLSDGKQLNEICKSVIAENQNAVEKYKRGDGNVLNFLIGEVMKKTKGRADFNVLRKILEKLLG